ncbi:hypothetical protein CA984_02300 [Streptosporangium minutum]|uniref:Uncharacterized protein n=1 Tax=Streptosporangium minutum TaxID=569862 RepID=A0A243RX04_9ACTN|nr:hypothetical protein CA984_02300 [Streptosporangium minutum]
MLTEAMAESPEVRVPPLPLPRSARTVNPIRRPAAFAGTDRVALHEPPEQALPTRTNPTLPVWLVETW